MKKLFQVLKQVVMTPPFAFFRCIHMFAAGTVAGLTGDPQITPGCFVCIVSFVVVDLRAGIMATGTGILIDNVFAPGFGFFPLLGFYNPHYRKNTELSIRKFRNIKLFPEFANNVIDSVCSCFFVRTRSGNKKVFTFLKHSRRFAVNLQTVILVEVSDNVIGRSSLEFVWMQSRFPPAMDVLMAFLTLGRADIHSRVIGRLRQAAAGS